MSNALTRLKRVFKRDSDCHDLEYLKFNFGPHPIRPYRSYANALHTREGEEDQDEDTSSNYSVSTNATMDNIPGPGRIIDTHIYQFLGRKLERCISRISVANLSPNRIAQCLWVNDGPSPYANLSSNDGILWIGEEKDIRCESGVRLAGLKSLVKQSQSDSLYRSAAALSALICLSTSDYQYNAFYVWIAAVKPIFHLETLASALDDSNPEKKYLLFLPRLAQAQLHFNWCEVSEITEEVALCFRQRFIGILDSCQSPDHDPLVAIAKACHLFAKSAACCFLRRAFASVTPATSSALETTAFLSVFLVRSLFAQYQTRHSNKQLQALVLSTFSRWFEAIMSPLLNYYLKLNNPLSAPICALRGLFHAVEDIQAGFLFPRIRLDLQHWYSDHSVLRLLPRRMRVATPRGVDPIEVQSYLMLCRSRFRRLLTVPNELRREASDTAKLGHAGFQSSQEDPPLEEKSEEEWQRSLERARQASINMNDLTEEFSKALAVCEDHEGDDPLWKWKWYKRVCQKRHRMGELFRSSLEWDWDLSNSLKRLFRIERPTKELPHEVALQSASIHKHLYVDKLGAVIVSTGIVQKDMPQMIRVPYQSETGEKKFKTFVACPSYEEIGQSVVESGCAQ